MTAAEMLVMTGAAAVFATAVKSKTLWSQIVWGTMAGWWFVHYFGETIG